MPDIRNNISVIGAASIVGQAAGTSVIVAKAPASATANIHEWQKSDNTVYCTITENGYFTTRKVAAPADAELTASEMSVWFDDTNGAAVPMWKGKSANGTVVSGSMGAGSGSSPSIGGTITSGTTGSILFVGSGPVFAENNSYLFWNNTTHRLGLNSTSPSAKLHILPESCIEKGLIIRAGTTTSTITNVALTSNVATITTSTDHGLDIAQKVTISGLTNSVLNGTYNVSGTPSATTFRYSKVNSDIASTADSGTVVGDYFVNAFEYQDSTGAARFFYAPFYSSLGSGSSSLGYLALKPGLREYQFGAYDAGGSMFFTRSDVTNSLIFTPDSDNVRMSCNTGVFIVAGSGGTGGIILSPYDAGGAGAVQIGRRFYDSNAAVGANVQCWPITGQTTPALGVVVPGGGSYTWQVMEGGAQQAPSASLPAIIAKGAASQTAAIQEWRNSGDTPLSSIDKDGYGFVVERTFILGASSAVTTGTNKTNQITVTRAGKIVKAYINAKTAPTGAALIVDINKNGTSIWASTQANRLQLAASATTGTQTSFDTVALAEGDVLTIDVDQVGSTVAGTGITVQLLTLCKNL